MAQREFAMRWTPPYMLQMLLHLAINKPSTVAFKCASNCKHSSLESKCIDCIIVEVLGHKKISFVNICDETPNLVNPIFKISKISPRIAIKMFKSSFISTSSSFHLNKC